jgi:hypothetical protein
LFHAELFVTVNSSKPEREAGTGSLRSDNVVCYAEGDVGCRRQLLVKLARIAAVRPPRGLPTKKEFL